MEIRYNEPADRGVTTLMYVGDDNAVEKAVSGARDSHFLFGGIAAIVAMQSRGTTRLVALGVLSYIGYRAYRAR